MPSWLLLRSWSVLLALALLVPAPAVAQDPPSEASGTEEVKEAEEQAANEDEADGPGLTPFRVSIGASFDFLDQISAKDLYGDVEVFLPNLWGPIGLDVGFFNGRATRRSDTIPTLTAFVGIPTGTDSTTVVRQSLRRLESGFEDRLGLYAGVLVELEESVHLTFQSEVLQRDLETVIADTLVDTDTLRVRPDTASDLLDGVPGDRLNSRLIENSSRSFPATIYQSQFSVGLVVRHAVGDAEVYLKPLLGVGAVGGEWEGLYSVRFAVTDGAHGFKLGGDVRGRLDADQVSVIVYLAKSFSLTKLAEFLGS